jgi:hypothetical protein
VYCVLKVRDSDFNNPIKNMKTTALGIITIIATLSNVALQILSGGSPDLAAAFAAIVAGAGLIQASDAK